MSSLELQASSGPATVAWHSINWAACHRRVRSLQRRIVQAVRAGAWRKAKRLSFLKGKVLRQQQGVCPNCRQVIQYNEEVELHHKDGHHQNNRLANLVVLHPNCHRQVHYAPERKTVRSRPLRGVGHA